jgi:hypothetical protein
MSRTDAPPGQPVASPLYGEEAKELALAPVGLARHRRSSAPSKGFVLRSIRTSKTPKGFQRHHIAHYNNQEISPLQDVRNYDMALFAEF